MSERPRAWKTHDVVNGVENSGPEGLAQGLVDLALDLVEVALGVGPAMNWLPTLDVMMMIVFLKLDPALAVGQAAVVKHLQQDVEDVGMRLLISSRRMTEYG